jgi:hypothetical protein
MQTDFKIKNKASGVEEAVLAISFAPAFIVAATATQSVRFEKNEGELSNDFFEIEEGEVVVVETAVEEEAAIEEEVADVVVDPAAGTVTGVDVATEGGDTTVTETVGEVPAAPVTETTETTEPVTTQ